MVLEIAAALCGMVVAGARGTAVAAVDGLETLLLLLLLLLVRRWTQDGGLGLGAGMARDGRQDGRLGAALRGVSLRGVECARDALGRADDERHVLAGRHRAQVVLSLRLGLVDRGTRGQQLALGLPWEGVMLLLRNGALV